MEKRLNTKLNTYISDFKKDICKKITETKLNDNNIGELLEYIYEYTNFNMTKEDFTKRKRIKNTIPITNRCIAKRANNEQCTRRRKNNCDFCGTHLKSTHHGLIDTESSTNQCYKLEVHAIDINGIIYYIDNYNNVYDTEDIINNIQNPRIIHKYGISNDEYYICNNEI